MRFYFFDAIAWLIVVISFFALLPIIAVVLLLSAYSCVGGNPNLNGGLDVSNRPKQDFIKREF